MLIPSRAGVDAAHAVVTAVVLQTLLVVRHGLVDLRVNLECVYFRRMLFRKRANNTVRCVVFRGSAVLVGKA